MGQFELLSNREPKQYPSLVRDSVALIEAEFAYLYGIGELADRLEVTKHHLIRLFSTHTGISPGKYLIDVRVAHAENLLRIGGDTPMEIIAGACGYSCANYFSKVFRKHTGLTPTDYRKLSQAESGPAGDKSIERFYL